jgi:hypothetical protein
MWKNMRTPAAFVLGVLVGTGSAVAFFAARDGKRQEVFREKLRCKEVADSYVKSNSEEGVLVTTDRVEYSAARNSCLASIDEIHGRTGGSSEYYRAVDLMSGEVLYAGFCNNNTASGGSYCGNGKNVTLERSRDDAFVTALQSTKSK